MATVSPAPSIPSASNIPVLTWTGVSTADTMTPVVVRKGSSGAVQMTGTWGSATVKLQGSLDGTTYFDLKDASGTTISATSNAYFQFTTSAVYLKPASSGGTADNVDVVLVLRG